MLNQALLLLLGKFAHVLGGVYMHPDAAGV